ncbi:hypothetical protein MP638_000514 [Amoeboaphelidium occidentale]|nr:hypothetical protein MP638_000514 [Amoeboaphelidium occidentale]
MNVLDNISYTQDQKEEHADGRSSGTQLVSVSDYAPIMPQPMLFPVDARKNLSLFIDTAANLTASSSMLPTVPPSAHIQMSGSLDQHNASLDHHHQSAPQFVTQRQLLRVVNSFGDLFEVSFGPRVEGGFFKFENIWTCYRRNYFRVLSTFNLISLTQPGHVVTADDPSTLFCQFNGQNFQISGFKMTLTAFSNNNSDKRIELVTFNGKSKSPATSPSPRSVLPGGRDFDPVPPKTPLTPHSDSKKEKISTMAAFDRIQFRTATSNNGKRKAIQQYFRLMLELHAVCTDGSSFKIAETSSEDIVVRGRSPGHYADVQAREKKKAASAHPYAVPDHRRNSWATNFLNQSHADLAFYENAPLFTKTAPTSPNQLLGMISGASSVDHTLFSHTAPPSLEHTPALKTQNIVDPRERDGSLDHTQQGIESNLFVPSFNSHYF